MTIMGKLNRLGSFSAVYPINHCLFEGNNGAEGSIELKKGVYYIRAQGGGGAGGSNVYYGNGGGGGSGAGFEGEIYIYENATAAISTGIGGSPNGGNGNNTVIGTIFTFGGGGGGGNDNNRAGIGGTLVVGDSGFQILNYTIKSNGFDGGPGSGAGSIGGHSVLTGNGAGGDPLGNRNASQPGAGGGGGKPWSGTGGKGMYGELLIKYIRKRP